MTGISTPDYETIAVRFSDALKAVVGMPATIVHKEQRIQLTQAGLNIDGYDWGKGARHYWEIRGPLTGDDVELPARDYYVDPTLWELWGIFGFSNRMTDGKSSTEVWRGIIKDVRDALRQNLTIIGAVHKAPRGTSMPQNGIAQFFDGSLVHLTRIRQVVEVITEIPV